MADNSEKKKEYAIGRGKPPKATQFVKGKSGNPKGRPKGLRNFATDLKEELAERIPVKEGGKTRKISKQRALVKALMSKGLQSSVPALAQMIELIDRLGGMDLVEVVAMPLAEIDEQIIAAFREKIRAELEAKSDQDPQPEADSLTKDETP